MKIPFYTLIGPAFRKRRTFIRGFCKHPLLGISGTYAAILGLLGVILSLFDMVMIIKCGPVLPGYMLQSRPKSGFIVAPEVERDLKLLALMISLEYYLFLVLALITKNPIFFLPFLVLYAFIIVVEFVNFILKIFVEGLRFCRTNMFTSMFLVYNWLCVFCTFYHMTDRCDY